MRGLKLIRLTEFILWPRYINVQSQTWPKFFCTIQFKKYTTPWIPRSYIWPAHCWVKWMTFFTEFNHIDSLREVFIHNSKNNLNLLRRRQQPNEHSLWKLTVLEYCDKEAEWTQLRSVLRLIFKVNSSDWVMEQFFSLSRLALTDGYEIYPQP